MGPGAGTPLLLVLRAEEMCPVSALLSSDVGIGRLNGTKNARGLLDEGASFIRSAGQTEATGR